MVRNTSSSPMVEEVLGQEDGDGDAEDAAEDQREHEL
jgi:hypothetical protein